MTAPSKRMYTREEAAEYCGISYYKIANAVRNNTIPARKNGRDILIDVADLDAYIDSFEVA
uniref:helix-turn-helix domain-containing protein n=1 Tax=Microbacterium proteolyticum TaxID=1572644 RepID=UPI00241627F1|nr:helix-turn-helix domain-containing protein [Microbacterium proteolyticum]